MHILSFDIEDWFHLLEHDEVRGEASWAKLERKLPVMVARILDLLDETGRKATFFCLSWVAREFPELIREIDRRGHEIGSHSDVHSLIFEQSPAQFASELARSKALLEQVSGKPVTVYRAPGFSLVERSRWAFNELVAQGFEIDCSIFPASRAHGGFPSFPYEGPGWVETGNGRIKEMPMSAARIAGRRLVFSGGGYFRLLPLPVLRRLWRASRYTMTYFHPRDFEPDQPMMAGLSAARRFKSYYGLGSAEAKLRAILTDYDFVSVTAAAAKVDWGMAPVYQTRSAAPTASGDLARRPDHPADHGDSV
ncbi:MAG: polysaccharide deacetylase family protein [Sphingomicrobium sp.]